MNFIKLVLELHEHGYDWDESRWAAGQATMRLPEGSFDETFKLAVQALRPTAQSSRSASAGTGTQRSSCIPAGMKG